jgi:hypothetical protein
MYNNNNNNNNNNKYIQGETRLKKIFFVHAYNSQLIQRTHLSNSHQKKIISFLAAKNDQDLQLLDFQCHKCEYLIVGKQPTNIC